MFADTMLLIQMTQLCIDHETHHFAFSSQLFGT